MSNLKETYNRIARDWHEDHQSDTWWVAGTKAFASYLPSGAHVLDIGCAGGTKSKFFIERDFTVTGIDLSEKMVEIAKNEVPEATFHALDVRDITNLTDKFDGIFIQAVLLHIPKSDIATVLKNIVSLLKPTGYLYLAVKEQHPDGPDEETKTENDYGYEYKRFFSYFTKEELTKYIQQSGLTVTEEIVVPAGKTNWLQYIAQM